MRTPDEYRKHAVNSGYAAKTKKAVMRVADASKGFFLCFLLNMFFNFEWGLFALILFLLHLWLNVPLWIALVLLGVWIAISLTLALLVTVHAIRPSKPKPEMDEKYTAPVTANPPVYSFGPETTAFIQQKDPADTNKQDETDLKEL